MEIKNQILEILKQNPTLSCSEIGKLLNKARGTIHYHLKKLNIIRDRNEIRNIFTELIKDYICESMKYKLHL